jgi:putative component of membrane protein insertase Oxa1/YidC/SpoIIIJ protein YidD
MFFFGFDRKTPIKGYRMLYLKMYKCNPFIEFNLHYKTGGYNLVNTSMTLKSAVYFAKFIKSFSIYIYRSV